ncbi:Eco57I restriction-modification methylase domain-containing protein [Microcoleus sp. AT3-D2]|uniref:Eco57I restriction-modification methylase domain-containing protein n=1 Tax=Microcoleus sp. AT3-D2 TaxID=2818612 RepID=UPI002FD5B2D7
MKLSIFNELDFLPALRALFKELQVPINAVIDSSIDASDILTNTYRDRESFNLINDVYFLGMVDDGAFRGRGAIALENVQEFTKDYEGIVIFGVTLKGREGGLLPTRSQLAEISRAFNREFCYTPVVVVFKYAGADGEYLAFANTERSKYKRDQEGEKAGKVTLLRDIDIRQPHSGHEKILADLKIPNAGKDRVDSFDKLYKYWQKVLDVSLLNKQFYKEVSTWYFHACKQVVFPKDAKDNQESLIRLITRLMFVWFLKEKGLVPDALFDKQDIQSILKSLEPQESTYYKAILQNLFFATLNTEGKREFIKESSGGRNSRYMVHNTFRYQDYFQQPNQVIDDYFADIPFLNGGLFECLDRRDENEPEVRIDGFSNNPKNPLSVPNDLFFGELQDVDLNADFGTSRKKYKVRGLVEIFKNYKFTIAENTPFEEDVALDPELLGQVFENLLAAYNPETQTTARKQTGSFYTPREIVNYMVDESLIAYLKNQLLSEEAELEQKLRQLLSFDDVNSFAGDDAVQECLIKALDNCKILDPACGSGAFPMGVLQKMVHILAKLDPHNEGWRNQQREREILPVLADLQQAQKISYEQARDAAVSQLRERLAQIEDDFANNEKDYPRKLFLIENCIYGVDIQPIALQITKLRCFISLIVEQKVDNNQPNRGILPLPNLETKFVAANSLISLPLQMSLRSPAVQEREKELKEVRQKHFMARSKATKDKYRLRDQELRNEIRALLKDTGLEVALADSLARWNPYNQNTSADFFAPEWMFGIADGFDIVIGNPPYGKLDTKNQKYFTETYKHQDYQKDMYLLFLERCLDLLKGVNSILSMIVPNTWLSSVTYKKIRKYLSTYYTWLKFLHVSTKVFQAVVDTHAFVFIKNLSKAKKQPLLSVQIDILGDNGIFSSHQISHESIPTDGNTINIVANEIVQKIYRRIIDRSLPLSSYCDVFNGVKPFEKGKGKPPQTDKIMRDKPYVLEGNRPSPEWKPLLRGSLIQKYQVLWDNNYWILYGEWLAAPRNPAIFEAKEKLCIRQTGDSIIATLISNQFIARDNLHIAIIKNDVNSRLCFILGIINSKIMDFVYTQINPEKGEVLAQVKKNHVEQLPIPTATEAEQKAIETLVGYVLHLTAALKDIPSVGQGLEQASTDKVMTQYFEKIIDGLVYELYLPEELHAKDKYFMRYLLSENLPNIDKIKGDKMTELRQIFQKLFHKDHPIAKNLFFLDNVEVIRIIEGKK